MERTSGTPSVECARPFDVDEFIRRDFTSFGPEQIPPSFQNEVWCRLIDSGVRGYASLNLRKFRGLDQRVAEKLLRQGWTDILLGNVENFSAETDIVSLVGRAVDRGDASLVLDYASRLLGRGAERILARILNVNRGTFDDRVARLLPYLRDRSDGAFSVPAFVEEVMRVRRVGFLWRVLGLAEHLDGSVARRLIERGEHRMVATHLSAFDGLQKGEAMALAASGQARHVLRDIGRFAGVDREVYLTLARKGCGEQMYHAIGNYPLVTREDVVAQMVEDGGMSAERMLSLPGAETFDREVVRDLLLRTNNGETLANHLRYFDGMNQKDLAMRLIRAGQGNWIFWHLDEMAGLDGDVVQALIEDGRGHAVEYHARAIARFDPHVRERIARGYRHGYIRHGL